MCLHSKSCAAIKFCTCLPKKSKLAQQTGSTKPCLVYTVCLAIHARYEHAVFSSAKRKDRRITWRLFEPPSPLQSCVARCQISDFFSMFTTEFSEFWLSYSTGVTVCCSPGGTVLHGKLSALSLPLHHAAQKIKVGGRHCESSLGNRPTTTGLAVV